jgi:hypothetical protein
MDKGDKKLLEDIKTHGWHVLKVFDENGALPNFAYSVGAYHSFNQPEIILFGLGLDDMHEILNEVVEAMKAGKRILPDKGYSDFLDGYDCVFRSVKRSRYEEYLGYANWFYKGRDFPALQLFWPDRNGYYPWEEGFSKTLIDLQPLLYQDESA